MQIVWDEPKRLANLAKHGLDFASASRFDWVNAKVVPVREGRYKAIGTLEGATVSIIFRVLGSEAISVISFRRASPDERRLL